jgi:hypothetical protein
MEGLNRPIKPFALLFSENACNANFSQFNAKFAWNMYYSFGCVRALNGWARRDCKLKIEEEREDLATRSQIHEETPY